jgi:hypothetical protein
MARGELEAHRAHDCTHARVRCPFAEFACDWEGRRGECGAHADSCTRRDSVREVLSSTRTMLGVQQSTIDQQQHTIALLQAQLARLAATSSSASSAAALVGVAAPASSAPTVTDESETVCDGGVPRVDGVGSMRIGVSMRTADASVGGGSESADATAGLSPLTSSGGEPTASSS